MNPLFMALYIKDLLKHDLRETSKMQKFLKQGASHPRSPFIGRSVRIFESGGNEMLPTNMQFLQVFGHHIHFLIIEISNFTEAHALNLY